MAKVYSEDLRERLIRAVAGGQSASAASRIFAISRSSGIKWVQHWRRTGEVPKASDRGSCRLLLDKHKDWLLALIDGEPDLTLEEIRRRLYEEHGMTACVNNLWRFFHRYKVVYKKTVLASEQNRPDVAKARQR